MRILVIGGDGYLGWPQSMYFSKRGHEVFIFDNLSRRHFDLENDCNSILPILNLHRRVKRWKESTGIDIKFQVGSTLNYPAMLDVFRRFQPETVIHFAEQKSAPYSMLDREHASHTMHNNVDGTLNVLYAIKEAAPNCHLIKLGTMGEYGTPNIHIEEGYLEIEHKGRKDNFLYPKNPGSFYHLSKVHDSHNIKKCCDWWGIRATDLNQGIVYGVESDEISDPAFNTRYDYDHIFGTVLNRFCVQAAIGYPLIVHGTGEQTRGYIQLRDTLSCVELAALNPPGAGEFRVFNQFTEIFSIQELAEKVKNVALKIGLDPRLENVKNPRIESEKHFYSATNSGLKNLGLKPSLLNDQVIQGLIEAAAKNKDNIDPSLIKPVVRWDQPVNSVRML